MGIIFFAQQTLNSNVFWFKFQQASQLKIYSFLFDKLCQNFIVPSAKRKFKDQASVLKHMNQPHSWCWTCYKHLLAVSLLKWNPIQQQHLQPISTNPTDSNCLSDVFLNPPNSTYNHVLDTPLVHPLHKDSNYMLIH